MPIVMQASNGETSTAAPMPHRANSSATVTIRRLSVERFAVTNARRMKPMTAPMTISRMFSSTGFRMISAVTSPPMEATEMETATENATRLTMSSKATTDRSVST